MLFKQELLEDIKSGNVSLVYRRWKKPLVKGGKLLKTAIGIIGIAEIHQIDDNEISHDDAAHAGYNDVQTLLASVNNGNTGNLYKISVYFHSEDPRIELRNNDSLNENDIEEITTKTSTIGHSHVLHPNWRKPDLAKHILNRLVLKAASRLRRKKYFCKKVRSRVRSNRRTQVT